MFIIRILLLILVLCACVQAQPNSQHDSPLAKKLVTALKVKAPEWKLASNLCHQDDVKVKISGQAKEKQIKYEFVGLQYGGTPWPYITVIPYSSDSSEHMLDEYGKSKNGLGFGHTLTAVSEVVDSLGDENFIWQSNSSPERGVTFRKGKVFVILSSNYMHLAKMFAQYLESEL